MEAGRENAAIQLPVDLAQHVTVLGKMGSGKTTTAARLIEAAAMAGWAVVIVDAKGFGSLRTVADRFATRFDASFHLVAPDDPSSLRYNPCTGTPSQISNKLIGAFSFGENAEIYKQSPRRSSRCSSEQSGPLDGLSPSTPWLARFRRRGW